MIRSGLSWPGCLNAQPPAVDVVYLIPYNDAVQQYGFQYLYQGAAPAHVTAATTAHNLAQKIRIHIERLKRISPL